MEYDKFVGRLDRKDRLLRERIHDTYKMRSKLKGPARCPRCDLIYDKGRWQKMADSPRDASEQTCSACHRILDNYPAGEITLTGEFALGHSEEITSLARHIEAAESAEHPLNRIISVEQAGTQILITTTDIHLPGRIGKAIERAWGGALDIHFDEGGYFARITWRRDT